MREILITPECLEFIDNQNDRISTKFYQIIEVIGEVKIVHSDFAECTKVVCLNGFQKKSTKDYVKAVKKAEKILNDYL